VINDFRPEQHNHIARGRHTPSGLEVESAKYLASTVAQARLDTAQI